MHSQCIESLKARADSTSMLPQSLAAILLTVPRAQRSGSAGSDGTSQKLLRNVSQKHQDHGWKVRQTLLHQYLKTVAGLYICSFIATLLHCVLLSLPIPVYFWLGFEAKCLTSHAPSVQNVSCRSIHQWEFTCNIKLMDRRHLKGKECSILVWVRVEERGGERKNERVRIPIRICLKMAWTLRGTCLDHS